MKRVMNLLTPLVFASLAVFMSCGGGGDDDAPPQKSVAEKKADMMDGKWSVNTAPGTGVTFDGSREGDWSSFTLTFKAPDGVGGTYTTSNVPTGYEKVWGKTGSWTFKDDKAEAIVRTEDKVEIGLVVSDDLVTLTFTVPKPSSGRVSGIGKPWKFSMVPSN